MSFVHSEGTTPCDKLCLQRSCKLPEQKSRKISKPNSVVHFVPATLFDCADRPVLPVGFATKLLFFGSGEISFPGGANLERPAGGGCHFSGNVKTKICTETYKLLLVLVNYVNF
eukprot:g24659.t1